MAWDHPHEVYPSGSIIRLVCAEGSRVEDARGNTWHYREGAWVTIVTNPIRVGDIFVIGTDGHVALTPPEVEAS